MNKKIGFMSILLITVSCIFIVTSVAASVTNDEYEKLQSVSPQSTKTTTFSHNFNNSYSDKTFFNALRGNLTVSSLLSSAKANTQVSLSNNMAGQSAVTLVGNNGKSYKSSEFAEVGNQGWFSSGNADAGKQSVYAVSHNGSHTVHGSDDYYGYIAKSDTY